MLFWGLALVRQVSEGRGTWLTGCWWIWAATGWSRSATWPEGGLPETVSRARLEWPLDDEALEDLRWYLEDYLRAPFGVWEDRGPRIQAQLAGWGEAVFASVFGSGPARDAYQRARDQAAWSWCSGRRHRGCWGCRGS